MSAMPNPDGFRWKIGSSAQWLRDKWILAVVVLLAAAALATLPWLALDDDGRLYGWALATVTVLGVLAAIASLLDRVADWHTKRVDEVTERAQRGAAQKMLTALLPLLDEIHDVAFAEGRAREALLVTLRSSVAVAAAEVPVASDVRATYYPLTRDAEGWRELRNPKSRGRIDEASTEFFEVSAPEHPVWNVIDSRDSDCAIYSAPDTAPQVDWDSRPYNTFISVPVRASDVVFGMLSVNAPRVGDLTELDRLAVIAIARTMAAALAVNEGPRRLQALRSQPDPDSMGGNESGRMGDEHDDAGG